MPKAFLLDVSDETELLFDSAERFIDYVRYLIANRAGDVTRVRELRKLRGEVHAAEYVEAAPRLIEIYHRLIAWAQGTRTWLV